MIREATPAAARDLARLHALAFAEPWSADSLAGMIRASGAIALVADGGFILARALAGEAEILTLAVRPDARRQGLGRRLVEAVAEKALAAGADSLFLEVAADNAIALGLYLGCGFAPAGRRVAYYRRPGAPPMDALILKRALRPVDA